jgi:hypothetical protein
VLCSTRSLPRVLAAVSGLACGAPALAQTIYFCDIMVPSPEDGAIRKINADGSGLQDVLVTGGGLLSLAVDTAGNRIYFANGPQAAILRCNLDGSNVATVVSGFPMEYPAVVRLDLPAQRVIWGDQSFGEIDWAFLTGAGPFGLATTPFHRGLFNDGSKLWWSTSTSSTSGDIIRANLDGSGQTTILSGIGKPAALAVDPGGAKVYWTDYVTRTVRRMNFDGSGLQTLYTDAGGLSPRGIALDLVAGKVYWGQDVGEEPTTGAIFRANLDGSDMGFIAFGLGLVQDLAIVHEGAPPCYANCDASTAAPVLNVADFTCFLQKFAAADPYANCDGSTASPVLNVADFTCFLQKFAAGCR